MPQAPIESQRETYPLALRQVLGTTFSQLLESEVRLDEQEFAGIASQLARLVRYGPNGKEDSPPWTDEPRFVKWLTRQRYPRKLALFLYQQTPERDLFISCGDLFGVASLMQWNSRRWGRYHSAGFVIIGSGPNGDSIAVDFIRDRGATGFISLEDTDPRSVQSIRQRFIAVADSPGAFLWLEQNDEDAPRDWFDAKNWTEAKRHQVRAGGAKWAPDGSR